MPYLSSSEVVIHYEEALYQVYGPLSLHLPLTMKVTVESHVRYVSIYSYNMEVNKTGKDKTKTSR